MATEPRYYARPSLTEHLVSALQGDLPFGDGANGIFLAAPRRTGKTTFLRRELGPALENLGATVIYVDLWSEDREDPTELLREAIGQAIEDAKGLLPKAAKALGVSAATIDGWISFDTAAVGKTADATLSSALGTLARMTDAPVALIVDEAQQALVTEAGESTMRALKAARDAMNTPDDVNLMLVMTGSDRDKLLRLTNTNASAFLGSEVQPMPLLGRDYIERAAADLQAFWPDLAPVDTEALHEAFVAFGYRPQALSAAIGQALNPLEGAGDASFESIVLERAHARRAADREQMSADYLALDPLPRAVLSRLLQQRERFRPYDADALAFYRARLDEAGSSRKVDAQAVQRAIAKLRAREPSLVWKSARGEYAPQDARMHDWYEALQANEHWPPQGAA